MSGIDRFLAIRERVIKSGDSRQLFAPDSPINLWHFAGGGDNQEAFAYIRQFGLLLTNVRTAELKGLSECPSTILLFATTWEPYSAMSIGTIKRAFDVGESESFGIVFFEHLSEEVRSMKHSSWYWPYAYVLASESLVVRSMIRRTPFRIIVGRSGIIEDIIEGIVK